MPVVWWTSDCSCSCLESDGSSRAFADRKAKGRREKVTRKTILKGLVRLSEGTALKAAGKISVWGSYQPKEPGREKQPEKRKK